MIRQFHDFFESHFQCKFLQIQIASVSGYVKKHYISKICQIVAGISKFHESFDFSFLASFWRLAQTVYRRRRRRRRLRLYGSTIAVTGVTALHILEDAIGDLEPRPSQGLVAIHIH